MNTFKSSCPATGAIVWEGRATDDKAVCAAVARSREAFESWSITSVAERTAYVRAFEEELSKNCITLATAIAQETGKPFWEAQQEVAAMIAKIGLSISAQSERTGEIERKMAFGRAVLRHRPHGVMAVLGPYNFPGHLPNGHIVPALLAGDTVVFKPSEETPLVGELMVSCWTKAGLPEGVVSLVQGGRETGASLTAADIDGLLFTGSAITGAHLQRSLIDRPGVMLALEMGGNNPLIAWDGEASAVASIIAQSAFISAGQRCSCARRLIVRDDAQGQGIIEAAIDIANRLRTGQWNEEPVPFMGPLISQQAADTALGSFEGLVVRGGRVLKPLERIDARSNAFVTPAIIDVTGIEVPDQEIFAPVLQVLRVPDFDAAINAANNTVFGLAGGLVSEDPKLWKLYGQRARCGVLNWNRPTTGAAGSMPFGGLGSSGNHRPSAYYAADYCAYPVASFEAERLADISDSTPGILSTKEEATCHV